LGCGATPTLAKRSRVPNGVAKTSSSRTATIWLPYFTSEMPKAGRRWLSVARVVISHSALAARQLSRAEVPPPLRVWPAAVAQVRTGSIISAAAWYIA
jgi:hypothetical protein